MTSIEIQIRYMYTDEKGKDMYSVRLFVWDKLEIMSSLTLMGDTGFGMCSILLSNLVDRATRTIKATGGDISNVTIGMPYHLDDSPMREVRDEKFLADNAELLAAYAKEAA